ncbi:MAG: acylphosphatase [ANME-2 cluster archaeon]|jgi:acylphosphatase|nr:acylphosphatase [ANME-2 cluster archaeon]
MNNIKNIQATITNHVQMVGYREIVEAFGKERGLKGFVFNDVDGSVKVMAGGLESAISGFIQDLKVKRPDTKIETIEIQEDIALPSPFGRVVSDDIREMSERFDTGIGILGEMNIKLGNLDTMSAKLDITNNSINMLGDKIETLPERIAEAMKK